MRTLDINDPLIQKIMIRMNARSDEGIKKYGKTMRQQTKSTKEWIDDAQEELWDAIVYLEKVKEIL